MSKPPYPGGYIVWSYPPHTPGSINRSGSRPNNVLLEPPPVLTGLNGPVDRIAFNRSGDWIVPEYGTSEKSLRTSVANLDGTSMPGRLPIGTSIRVDSAGD